MTAEIMSHSSNWDPALTKLLNSLKDATALHSVEELSFLSELLQSKELNALVTVHNKIVANGKDDKFFPMLSTSMQIALEVLDMLAQRCHISSDCKELFHLLQTPHVQGLLCAHDAVAQKDYYPHLPDIPLEVDEDEETIKIVQLVKSNEPMGATIKMDDASGKIVIARIMHGGAADRSGLIHVGDEVVEVNGVDVEGKTPSDVLEILQNSEGTITFKLVPADGKMGLRESKVRVRAHFDYIPSEDPYIPCKEAGLGFERGTILHIVSQDDAYWWQARREGDRNMRAGLIPSRALQERRVLHERSEQRHADVDSHGLCSATTLPSELNLMLSCNPITTNILTSNQQNTNLTSNTNQNQHNLNPLRLHDNDKHNLTNQSPSRTVNSCAPRVVKTKRVMYDTAESDDFANEQVATYEEVAKLYPRQGLYRPLVLIGAPAVGRNELKRRLIATDSEKYRTPIPYTSRAIRPGEDDGKEYWFVSREQMERDISEGKFIEHGEYKGNLYGTSADSVTALVNAGYVCVLSPHYQALKMLRTPQLKPFIIYIKPPSFEQLKETRSAMRAKSTFDETNSRGFTDDEFREILRSSQRIEFLYGHLFDEQIINNDLPEAFEQLLVATRKVETEPLWVPANWVQ